MMRKIIKTAVKLLLGKGVSKSYSQNGEDILIEKMIGNKKRGYYVDIGAFHPVQYSNTYSLYRRGWRGLAIDPSPVPRDLFRVFRPGDIYIMSGVAELEDDKTYFMFSDPAYNTMSSSQAVEWREKGVAETGTMKVPCRPLRDILRDASVKEIDVLSIDTEGLDLEVLRSHDWGMPTGIIVVECHDFDPSRPSESDIFEFLSKKGYVLRALAGFSLIFKKTKSAQVV